MLEALRGRDLVVLVLVLLSLYHCLFYESRLDVSLEPLWFVQHRHSLDNADKALPILPPILVDFDMDGRNELVMIDDKQQLKVLDISEDVGHSVTHVYHPEELTSLSLRDGKPHLNPDSSNKQPLAMAAGCCLYPPSSPQHAEEEEDAADAHKEGLVAVVNADLSLYLYSYYDCEETGGKALHLHWAKDIATEMGMLGHTLATEPACAQALSAKAVIVDKHAFPSRYVEDSLVVVSFHLPDQTAVPKGGGSNDVCSRFGIIMYAFKAGNAETVWEYNSLRLQEIDQSAQQEAQAKGKKEPNLLADITLPQTPLAQDDVVKLLKSRTAFADAGLSAWNRDWNSFRSSILHALPHSWTSKQDTDLVLRHFERSHYGPNVLVSTGAAAANRRVSGKAAKKLTSNEHKEKLQLRDVLHGNRLFAEEKKAKAAPSNASKALPQLHDSSLVRPNVVVLHHQRGLKAFSLQTGAAVASLVLEDTHTYGDVDGDGNIDHIHFVSATDRCSEFVVYSGIPANTVLFNTSQVCADHMQRGNRIDKPRSKRNRRGRKYVPDNDPFAESTAASSAAQHAVPLIITHRHRQLERAGRQRASNPSRLAVVAGLSEGIVSAFSATGKLLWQYADHALSWNPAGKSSHGPPHVLHYHPYCVHAQLASSASASTASADSAVLVYGDQGMQLLSYTGEMLASVDLPSTPVGVPILSYDLDRDHICDILVQTETAHIAYRVRISAAKYPLAIPLLIVLLIAVVVYLTRLRIEDFPSAKKGSFASKVVHSLRSTDSTHLD